MKEIDRIGFSEILCIDYHNKNHYIITNEGRVVNEIWAENDTEAKQMFRKGDY